MGSKTIEHIVGGASLFWDVAQKRRALLEQRGCQAERSLIYYHGNQRLLKSKLSQYRFIGEQVAVKWL